MNLTDDAADLVPDPADDRADAGQAFRAGDEDACATPYERFGASVFHLSLASLRVTADAEDVTQATFVAGWLGARPTTPTGAACRVGCSASPAARSSTGCG